MCIFSSIPHFPKILEKSEEFYTQRLKVYRSIKCYFLFLPSINNTEKLYMKLLGLHLSPWFWKISNLWKIAIPGRCTSYATSPLPPATIPRPHRLCSYKSPLMWRWLRILGYIFFYMICNFFKCDDLKILQIKYLSYSMAVILLPSPLQPQSDTKFLPDKKASLMTFGFLLTDSMLEGYHK